MGVPDGLPIWWIDEHVCEHGGEFHEAALAWLRSLALDPHHLAPVAAVVRWNGAYELHVDEVQYESGRGDRFDPINQDELLKIRRIIPVAADSWPPMPRKAVA